MERAPAAGGRGNHEGLNQEISRHDEQHGNHERHPKGAPSGKQGEGDGGRERQGGGQGDVRRPPKAIRPGGVGPGPPLLELV